MLSCSSLQIVKLLPHEMYYYFAVDDLEYAERKTRFADELVEKAAELIPEKWGYIVVRDAATPRIYEKFSLNYKGAVYAFDQSIDAPPRSCFKTLLWDFTWLVLRRFRAKAWRLQLSRGL